MISYALLHHSLLALTLLAAVGALYLRLNNRKPLTYRTEVLRAYRHTRVVEVLLWVMALALLCLSRFGARA